MLTGCVYAPQESRQMSPSMAAQQALPAGISRSLLPVNDSAMSPEGFHSPGQRQGSVVNVPDHPQSRMLYNSRGERGKQVDVPPNAPTDG